MCFAANSILLMRTTNHALEDRFPELSESDLRDTPRSNARACAMHSYPVAGRENFPRQNLIDTISESVSREKKIERQWLIC